MLRAFSFYGKVMEVVIPPRRNKRGQRFGFVRFAEVMDPRFFAVKLDNIIIGANKIHVNIPRFEREKIREVKIYQNEGTLKGASKQTETRREWKEVLVGKEGIKDRKKEGVRGVQRYDNGATRNVKNEGNMVMKNVRREWREKKENVRREWKETKEQHEQKIVYFRKKNLCDLWYEVAEEEMAQHRKKYIGVLKNKGGTHMVQEWFNMQGFFSINVTPLGANKVLLEEMEEGIVPALIEDAKDWVYEVFDDIRGWSPAEVDNERAVWVRCHGIPIHAWNNDFFSTLARKFGTFLGVDENTRKKTSLDVARILIRTKCYEVFNMVVHARFLLH